MRDRGERRVAKDFHPDQGSSTYRPPVSETRISLVAPPKQGVPMSDDVAPAVEQDQPIDATEAPETEIQDQPTDSAEESFTDFDTSQIPEDADREWLAERYQQMQADYTRKTQDIGERRREAERAQQIVDALNDPTTAPIVLKQLGYDDRKLLEMYGYDLADGGDDEFDDDLDEEFYDPRVDALIEERQAERVFDYIAGEIADLEEKVSIEFTPEEHTFLDEKARANPNPDGSPNVEAAYQQLKALYKLHEGRITAGKDNTPRPPGGGKPATRQVDLSKLTPEERREERTKRMLQAAERSDASATA